MRKMMIIAAILAIGVTGYGQMLTMGTQEARIDGMIDFESAWGTDIGLSIGYGYFVADNLEFGGGLLLENNDEVTAWGIEGFGEYNFDLGIEFVPFAGATIAWGTYDFDKGDNNSAFILGAVGGGKYFIVDNVAVVAQLSLEWASEKIFTKKDYKYTDTNAAIEFGIRCFF
ncbi:MAG: hypothetical protein EOM20_16020 [Spartobacteria bacterium]|nr:hypothetical protein [Spartobacteria bacterium]